MRARDNPFRLSRVDNLAYRPSNTTWEALFKRLENLDLRAAIIGPYGSGKSTLLRALASRLDHPTTTIRYRRLRGEARHISNDILLPLLHDLTNRDIILVDEADLLPWPVWLYVKNRSRMARGLIITSHHPGRLPTLVQCTTDPALLGAVVAELLGHPLPDHEQQVTRLHQKHKGDIRQALRELYDAFAAR